MPAPGDLEERIFQAGVLVCLGFIFVLFSWQEIAVGMALFAALLIFPR